MPFDPEGILLDLLTRALPLHRLTYLLTNQHRLQNALEKRLIHFDLSNHGLSFLILEAHN